MRPVLTLPVWSADAPGIALRSATGDAVALLAERTICDPAFDACITTNLGATIIAWSGTTDDPRDDPFAPDPAAWLPASMPALLARLEALEPLLIDHRVRLLIRPHARHILSDAPRCGVTLRAPWRSTHPHIGLALDPVAMVEPSMIPTAIDHIRRSLEDLAHRASAVILTNFLAPDPADPDAALHPARLPEGVIPAADLIDLATTLIPADCPIAVLAGDAEAHPDLGRAPRYTAA